MNVYGFKGDIYCNFDISVVGAHNFMWQVCFQVSSNCNVKHILKIFLKIFKFVDISVSPFLCVK
jgi:hypothetical protein